MDTVSILMLCLNNTVDVDTAQTRLQGELDASDLLEKHGWLLPSVKICGLFCSTLSSVCLSVSRVLSLLSPVKVRTGLVSHLCGPEASFLTGTSGNEWCGSSEYVTLLTVTGP